MIRAISHGTSAQVVNLDVGNEHGATVAAHVIGGALVVEGLEDAPTCPAVRHVHVTIVVMVVVVVGVVGRD